MLRNVRNSIVNHIVPFPSFSNTMLGIDYNAVMLLPFCPPSYSGSRGEFVGSSSDDVPIIGPVLVWKWRFLLNSTALVYLIHVLHVLSSYYFTRALFKNNCL